MAHLPRGVDVLWAHLSAFERISRNIDVFESLALMFFVVFFVSAFETRLTFFGTFRFARRGLKDQRWRCSAGAPKATQSRVRKV